MRNPDLQRLATATAAMATAMSTVIAAMLATLGAPAAVHAASTTASSASDSASSAASSTSTSLRRSSDGSSKATGIAQGAYRVIDIAAVPGEPGAQRITLQAEADASAHGQWQLTLPAAVAQQAALAAGQVIEARPQVYGVAFAQAATGHAFFLVLDDDWHRELPSRPVL